MDWYTFTPRKPPRKWRAWMTTMAIDEAGRVFLPAAVTGRSDLEILLCLGWDGTTAAHYKDHLYAPADWMRREFPDSAEDIDAILAKVAQARKQLEQ